MSDRPTHRPLGGPPSPQAGRDVLPVPQAGGSYIREKDGSLTRTAFTRQPGEPEPAGEPKAEAKPAMAEALVKKGK